MTEERTEIIRELAPISLHKFNKEISWQEIIDALEAPSWREDELSATQAMVELAKLYERFQRLLDRSQEVVEANLSKFRFVLEVEGLGCEEDIKDCELFLQELKDRRPV